MHAWIHTHTHAHSHLSSVFIIWKWSIVIDCSLFPRATECWRCVENRILVACTDGVRIYVTVSLRHTFQGVQSKRTCLSKVKGLYRRNSNSCVLLAVAGVAAQADWSLSFIRKSLSFSIPWLTACSRIWKWLWYHRYNFLKTFIFPAIRTWCVPEDTVHVIRSSDSQISCFFPPFYCLSSLPFIFHFSPSCGKIQPRGEVGWFSRRSSPHKQMAIWSLLWRLSLSWSSTLNLAAGC